MFSAEEYDTAIRVMKAHSCEELAEGFVEFRTQANRREVYAHNLALESNPKNPPYVNGLAIIRKLFDDGWTPPKGLI